MMDCDPEHANVVMVFTPLYYIIYNYIYICMRVPPQKRRPSSILYKRKRIHNCPYTSIYARGYDICVDS